MTAVTALVGDYFTGAARDRYMGLQQAFVGIGGTLFLTGGGFLAEIHWRMPFLVYGLAFLLLPAAILFIREPQRRMAAHTAGEVRRTDRTTVVLLGLLLAGAMFNMVIFYMIPTQLPFFLKSMGHDAPSLAGSAIGLGQMVGVASALLFARIRQRLGVMGAFALAFGSIGAAFLVLSMAQSYGSVLVALAISGIGMGTIMPNFAATTMLLAPSHLRGRISGLLVSSIFLGQFLSPLVSQPLIAAGGFAAAWGVAGLAALVIAFGSLAIRLGLPVLGRARQGGRP
jgi:MFS family permease